MIYGLWHSAAGLHAQQVRQDVLANNLANVETPGFKPDGVSFRERLVAARLPAVLGDDPRLAHPLLDRLSGGLNFERVHTDFSQASLVPSGNPLDLAIDGDGFFAVRTDDGVRYTRNGRLALREDGTLVTAAGGFEVLDRSGESIRLDRSATGAIKVDEAGTVRQGGVRIAQVRLADFADRRALRKTGRNLFDAGAARPQPARGRVKQSAYESSGVNPVAALVRMIDATRAYELNATMITLQDQTLGRVVNDVGRLG